MQNFQIKKYTILFFAVFLLFTFSFIAIIKAQNNPYEFTPSVTIPGSIFEKGKGIGIDGTLIGKYINAIFEFFVIISAVLAVFMIMIAGVIWILAAGSSEKVGQAKKMIGNAVIGLILALGAYTILSLINPQLVILKNINVTPIKRTELTKETSFTAKRSGLDICKTYPDNYAGIKLSIIKNNSNLPLLKENINNIADVAQAKIACEDYCRNSKDLCFLPEPSSCIKGFSLSHDRSFVCCSCDNEIKINRISVMGELIRTQYTFDKGIQRQLPDASDDLLNLLNCIYIHTPKEIKLNISSISDSNCIGNLSICKNYTNTCDAKKGITTNCHWHNKNSCHYGGNSNQSYAVDINNKDSSTKEIITKVANVCNAKFVNPEDTHIHISVSPCKDN